jgi:hypothetical protein
MFHNADSKLDTSKERQKSDYEFDLRGKLSYPTLDTISRRLEVYLERLEGYLERLEGYLERLEDSRPGF